MHDNQVIHLVFPVTAELLRHPLVEPALPNAAPPQKKVRVVRVPPGQMVTAGSMDSPVP